MTAGMEVRKVAKTRMALPIAARENMLALDEI
jgi:hypothetical protein